MIKYVITSIVFFVIELFVFSLYQGELLQCISSININRLNMSMSQRKALYIVKRLHEINNSGKKQIFLFGGSTGVLFFKDETYLNQKLQKPIINMSIYSQDFFDTIRIVDNIKVPGSTIVLTIYPNRLFRQHNEKRLLRSRFLLGGSIVYPLKSRRVEQILQEQKITSKPVILKIFPNLNPYGYLLREQVSLNDLANGRFSKLIYNDKSLDEFNVKQKSKKNYENGLQSLSKWLEKSSNESTILNARLLHDLYLLAKKRGLNFILLELPYSTNYSILMKNKIRQYKKIIDSFVHNHPGTIHIPCHVESPRNEIEYFYDGFHVLPKGREYYNNYTLKGLKIAADSLQ